MEAVLVQQVFCLLEKQIDSLKAAHSRPTAFRACVSLTVFPLDWSAATCFTLYRMKSTIQSASCKLTTAAQRKWHFFNTFPNSYGIHFSLLPKEIATYEMKSSPLISALWYGLNKGKSKLCTGHLYAPESAAGGDSDEWKLIQYTWKSIAQSVHFEV